MNVTPVLEVKNLKIEFETGKGTLTATENVNFSIGKGEVFCIVGESGCGKSVTASSILGLLPRNVGRIADGSIIFDGADITDYQGKKLDEIRGKRISMIFQEPMTSLNPVYKIGKQMLEALTSHDQKLSKKDGKRLCIEMLGRVGIPDPERRYNEYPHQLSGGMRQRVMIAMALITNPELLIADEPTTALDVTIQAQILDLMRKLRNELNTSIMLITHDMGVVAEMADKVLVMYGGNVVETAYARQLFLNPLHPYTRGLLAAIPRLDMDPEELSTIEGTVPSLEDMPSGCKFCTRCPKCTERCKQENPPLFDVHGHLVACWMYDHSELGQYVI